MRREVGSPSQSLLHRGPGRWSTGSAPRFRFHVLILAPHLASAVMAAFASVDHLASIHNVPVVDEQMLHAYLEHSGLLNRTRLIATSHFEH